MEVLTIPVHSKAMTCDTISTNKKKTFLCLQLLVTVAMETVKLSHFLIESN